MAIALEKSGEIKGRSTQDKKALGAQHIKGSSFSAEGFLNGIKVIFLFTIKLGRVVRLRHPDYKGIWEEGIVRSKGVWSL